MTSIREQPPSADRLVARLQSIPPLPRQSRELLAAVCDPEIEVDALVALVERCPPLAARLLGVASSAFFAGAAAPRSVSDAVIRVLGLRLVCDLSLAIILTGPLKVDKCPGFRVERYWMSALGAGTLAARVWPLVGRDSAVGPYLAGLLHNIGVLALAHLCPESMAAAMSPGAAERAGALRERERALLGIDHRDAGLRLAAAWSLPPAVGNVIAHHRDPDYRGVDWPLAVTTGLCRAHLEPEPGPDWASARAALGLDRTDWEEARDRCSPALEQLADTARALAGAIR